MEKNTLIVSFVQNGVAWIKLNRPKTINVLNAEMVEEIKNKIQEWKHDESVAIICIYGAGEKGFCAGGDMKDLYERKDTDVEERAYRFFSTEYPMDWDIHTFPKPILAYMDGIVMGGGVGISIGASYRIVTERTKWAMPETNIGFYPDVGASYFLNWMPGYVGRYLGLTGKVIGPSDVLYIKAADVYMESSKWESFINTIRRRTWSIPTAAPEIKSLLEEYISQAPSPSLLAEQQLKIDKHFSFETVEQIIQSLDNAAKNKDMWAEETLQVLMSKSPTALKVTLRQLIECQNLSLKDCFNEELRLSMTMIRSHDFFEGVRSVLVDKDHKPKWKPKTAEGVTKEYIQSFFTKTVVRK